MAERLVVIGGDAAGMSAASQARRRRPDLDIVALEKGRFTSYSACGIPYLVGGEVGRAEDLVARTPEEFRSKQRIDVRIRHEAMAVDLDARTIDVRDVEHERSYSLGFDFVVFGTGAVPIRPDLPGIDAPWVRGVQTLEDAASLLAEAERSRCRDVVVVGAGYIGLEMAEAFHRRGAQVALVEGAPTVMGRTLDADMAVRIHGGLRDLGVDVRLGEQVERFEDGAVVTGSGRIPADLVVLGLGVAPASALAADAGVELGPRRSVAVDRRQRTSVDGVWAAGDCASTWHRVSERPVHIALGTVANKTGRVAGIDIGGGYATFPGVLGTAITKVCQTEVARTGLTEREAADAGFAVDVATIETTTTASYIPGTQRVHVKLVSEQGTGRVLGAQIVGGTGSAKRIDTVAAALAGRLTVTDLVDLDLAYAPPFSSVWDPIQQAARQIRTTPR
ncbi:MAG: FAD-dependent oxidoreductase [Actinobacteria bacterium]|nr:FAD-dependent oxidoreductase [Actinomycetota bacterium]